jgi:DNA-binding MarR family transcriptional regulator
MNDEEISRRLEALRAEMDVLSQEMFRSSYVKIRSDVDGRLMDALSQSGRDRLEKEMARIRGSSTCENREHCLNIVRTAAEEAISSYVAGDSGKALEVIESMELVISGISSPCGDSGCSSDCHRLLDDVRERIALSEKLSKATHEDAGKRDIGKVTAQDVYRYIDPLSHPARVGVLMLLSVGDMSFSEVSRELNLRTGHLQYHIKALVDAGYVDRKVSRGPFSLTRQGSVALGSAIDLARKLKE